MLHTKTHQSAPYLNAASHQHPTSGHNSNASHNARRRSVAWSCGHSSGAGAKGRRASALPRCGRCVVVHCARYATGGERARLPRQQGPANSLHSHDAQSTAGVAHALYFAGYEFGKRAIEPGRSMEEKSAVAHFGAGLIAELMGCLIWTPMDVIKQRQQAQKRSASYTTVPSAVRTILADAGPRGLFKGFGAGIVTYGPFVGIYFVIYEQWKRSCGALLSQSDDQLPFAVHISGGAVAGAAAAFVTTPVCSSSSSSSFYSFLFIFVIFILNLKGFVALNNVRLFICLFVYLFIYSFIHLFIYLFIHSFIFIYILFICLFIWIKA